MCCPFILAHLSHLCVIEVHSLSKMLAYLILQSIHLLFAVVNLLNHLLQINALNSLSVLIKQNLQDIDHETEKNGDYITAPPHFIHFPSKV